MTDFVACAIATAYRAYLVQWTRTVADVIPALPHVLAELVASYSAVDTDAFRAQVCNTYISYFVHESTTIVMHTNGLDVESWIAAFGRRFVVADGAYMFPIQVACHHLQSCGARWLDSDEVARELAASYTAAAQNVIRQLLSR